MPASKLCRYIEAMPEQPMMGRTLAALRAAHGWSRAELAERSGVSEAEISRYERGEDQPSIPTLEHLGEALQVRRYELRRWIDAVTAVVEGSSLRPPRLEPDRSASWPFLEGKLPWDEAEPGGEEGAAAGSEADRRPGRDPAGDPEVDRLAREAAELAARFVRLSFRRFRGQDSD